MKPAKKKSNKNKAAAKQDSEQNLDTPPSTSESQFDVVIVGGGLAGGLTALYLKAEQPELRICLIEATDRLAKDQTWCFHEGDISARAMEIVRPLISHSWDDFKVAFPRLERTVKSRLHAIRSSDFHTKIIDILGAAVCLNSEVTVLSESEIALKSGETLSAKLVLDARGPLPTATAVFGYQKAIAYDVLLEEAHGLQTPVVMDANSAQLDGFRYFYFLPWDDCRLQIGEAYYSPNPHLNHERVSRSIHSLIERRGWNLKTIEHEENFVTAIPLTSEYLVTSKTGEAIPIGRRAGYFHAMTGSTIADALRFAEFIRSSPDLNTANVRDWVHRQRRSWIRRQWFYRFVNRLLFLASEPGLRYTVLQRFYELPQEVIARFSAGKTTWADRLRIVGGKPPVPMNRALKNFTERTIAER